MNKNYYASGWNAYRNGEQYQENAWKFLSSGDLYIKDAHESWRAGWYDCQEATQHSGPQPEKK